MIFSLIFHHDARSNAFYALFVFNDDFLIVCDTLGLAGSALAPTGVMESNLAKLLDSFFHV